MSRVKLVALTSAAAILVATGAQAAPFHFAGFYFGGHAGYIHVNVEVEGERASSDIDGHGAIGAVHAGYNFIDGNLMYGVETDFALQNADVSGPCSYFDSRGHCEVDINPLGSLRGRVGFADSDFMVYATGGIAAAQFDFRSETGKGAVFDEVTEFGEYGWTAGIGLEYLLGDMMTVRLEYRYTSYFPGEFESCSCQDVDIDIDTHAVVTGLSWYF